MVLVLFVLLVLATVILNKIHFAMNVSVVVTCAICEFFLSLGQNESNIILLFSPFSSSNLSKKIGKLLLPLLLFLIYCHSVDIVCAFRKKLYGGSNIVKGFDMILPKKKNARTMLLTMGKGKSYMVVCYIQVATRRNKWMRKGVSTCVFATTAREAWTTLLPGNSKSSMQTLHTATIFTTTLTTSIFS